VQIFNTNVDHIVVQSEFMAGLLKNRLKREILILPFYEEKFWNDNFTNKIYDFCYIGLPSKHKNHEKLLSAIEKLAVEKYKFSVVLTIPDYPENQLLISEIIRINRILHGCVINYGLVDITIAHDIFSKSKAMVFTSRKESLGLPIIEALQHGIKVLSSDREFTHELISNPIIFNPENVLEIEKCMKNFLEHGYRSINQALKIKSELGEIIRLITS